MGWGKPADFEDPFVGFHETQPLFVKSDDGERFEIPRARRRFFHADSFPVRKGEREFRIFVFGGSTVAGEPFAAETSFTTWLELALRAADPDRDWHVVNCGGISYASYRLTPILQECLQYEPDLFIVSTGHNEFLEDRTYHAVKELPVALTGAHRLLGGLRTFTLLRAGIHLLRSRAVVGADSRTILPAEVDARLDHQGGLDAYHRDPAWASAIGTHFGLNLRRMAALARGAGIPLIFVRETSNLADCPPFKSEHRDGLSSADLENWEGLVESSHSLVHIDVRVAIACLNEALKIDDQYAQTWYELGKLHETEREYKAAREAFLRARDLDVCPLRMTSALESELFAVANETGTPVVDAQSLLEQQTAHGIVGSYWLVDHVHPSIAGHQRIAVALLEELQREGMIVPVAESERRRKVAFQEQMTSLPPIYFERGRRTLELLRGWTKGRADGSPFKGRTAGESAAASR